MNILITGSAGFIGFHLAKKILNSTKHNVIGVDNINNYYSIKLKYQRLRILKKMLSLQLLKVLGLQAIIFLKK